ncbi:anhydro-N-acetylmuramic acid kinase [Mycoplasmopsis ciconiae]|uniref:Anhydro-N-acetylmuramic acid kinase n=1 Tax=Mycoplasmopsis ciconiae TaxID=561067 RepID=A0ABU7ML85_9BACT|nr:anhydro-N-acetylmuramic acid kinase [Mycoplasmopsis ciconiae]
MKNKYKIIGLMSGTSVDGLDIALVNIEDSNELKIELQKFDIVKYPNELKNKIIKAINNQATTKDICSLNFEIAYFYAECVNNFLKDSNIKNNEIDLISSHGQTIYHLIDPSGSQVKSTLQIGDISVISKKTNIMTVGDFRTADMALSGQGAPLVPIFDYYLNKDKNYVSLFQNIGGMSNVSVIYKDIDKVFAFDNGPGNILIDLAVNKLYNQECDYDSKIALKGKINNQIISFLLDDPYYKTKPPKSTGREKYTSLFVDNLIAKFIDVPKEDLIHSLTYFSALVIANSYKDFIFKDNQDYKVFVSGGGARNKLMVQYLKELIDYPVLLSDQININYDAKEAIAFAFLGYLNLKNINSNVKNATGAQKYTVLGKIAK